MNDKERRFRGLSIQVTGWELDPNQEGPTIWVANENQTVVYANTSISHPDIAINVMVPWNETILVRVLLPTHQFYEKVYLGHLVPANGPLVIKLELDPNYGPDYVDSGTVDKLSLPVTKEPDNPIKYDLPEVGEDLLVSRLARWADNGITWARVVMIAILIGLALAIISDIIWGWS